MLNIGTNFVEIQKKCVQVATMEIQKNNLPVVSLKTQTSRGPKTRWMKEPEMQSVVDLASLDAK